MVEAWGKCVPCVAVFPVGKVSFALLLQHLSESTGSLFVVHEAVNCISRVNQLVVVVQSLHGPLLVSATLARLKRALEKPKVKRVYHRGDVIVLSTKFEGTTILSYLRLEATCLLAFAVFSRYDKLAKLRCCDIAFLETSMSIHISSSETD